MKKRDEIDVIRPRIESGVDSCRKVCRMTVLTMSAAPVKAKNRAAIHRSLLTAKRTVARP